MPLSLPVAEPSRVAPSGSAELVIDAQHFRRIVQDGIFSAKTSLDISTAD
ncbi:MAG: hypothetical protein JWN51_1989, partial [Phycisphaerales bacterium]|nr:hypothetical protein [Phycisphaerales bacterium]